MSTTVALAAGAKQALAAPLSRRVLDLATWSAHSTGMPSHVKVTEWGAERASARASVFYFGGMPSSAEEPALHSAFVGQDDIYKARRLHLVCIDKPGMGGSALNRQFRIRRDWPVIVGAVADELGVNEYGVLGMSNGGPHAMACLTATDDVLQGRVKAATLVVGATDVRASGYFSWSHPSGLLEGCFNSLPLLLTGPLVAVGLGLGRLYLAWRWKALMPKQVHRDEVKTATQSFFSDASRNWGLGASLDCQQGLSPVYARPVQDTEQELSAETAYGRITAPVKLWYGTQDSTVPLSTAHWLAKVIPDTTEHYVDGTHALFVDHAEAILDELVAALDS